MASAVQALQKAALNGSKPLSQLLREAKVIASKLNLHDVETWVDVELKGYPETSSVPTYRCVKSSEIQVHNPFGGWEFVGNPTVTIESRQPIAAIENYGQQEYMAMPLPLKDRLPVGPPWLQNRPQQFLVPSAEFKHIIDVVLNRLIDWTLELEKRGITGEDMNFDEKEKQAAASQTFNIGSIGTFSGVLGTGNNSPVTLYDYSSVCLLLMEKGVSQQERNELENLMDELRTAPQEKKQTLLQKGKDWITRNKDFLGAGTEIVARVLGAKDS